MVKGRKPLGEKTVRDDGVIARTVDTLIMWGFSGSPQVLRHVAVAAKSVLGRTRTLTDARALSVGAIEKIAKRHPQGFERFWDPLPEGMARPATPARRMRYAVGDLRSRRPRPCPPMDELAKKLMENDGRWPCMTERVWSPVDHTYDAYPVAPSLPEPKGSDETGVKK